MFSHLFGLMVVPHRLAREVRDEWRVEAHPIPKRRRRWRVVKHHIDRPGAYRAGNTLFVHPDLMEQLKAATESELRWNPAAILDCMPG